MGRRVLWYAAVPALTFFLASCLFLASLLPGNGWGIIPAMVPGWPWTMMLPLASSTAGLIVQFIALYAVNAGALFLLLATLISIATKFRVK